MFFNSQKKSSVPSNNLPQNNASGIKKMFNNPQQYYAYGIQFMGLNLWRGVSYIRSRVLSLTKKIVKSSNQITLVVDQRSKILNFGEFFSFVIQMFQYFVLGWQS
eukprot:TRINITY_DN4115_c0_g2_i1.p3 TRINITY_DN4115_c0_g2~~TRINITY_DN4115_c0_g2_i1.p3  ORF type:complete len:105 (+),score=3.89 TRINITY_DN4115_c0_g2_i1:340-654(+)